MHGRESSAYHPPMFSSNSGSKKNKEAAGTRVLLVGHCGPDAWFLKSSVKRALPGVEIEMVSSMAKVDDELAEADLLLVNRVLDGKFDSDSGIELIRDLKAREDHSAALMLISNYEEAQHDAQAAGAVAGFGKANANSDAAEDLLRRAVGLVD